MGMRLGSIVAASILLAKLAFAADERLAVQSPPDCFFSLVSEREREGARGFYKKYFDISGMPLVAASEVADEALERSRWIVQHLLAGRPDVLDAMVRDHMYLIVIGKDQLYCDLPEYSRAPNKAYLNERVRGTGGRPTSFGEENVLSLPLDRYDDESIAVHEFCHTIDSALRSIDPSWTERRNAVYHNAIAKGLWKNTYAASNPGEFWAEICQSYFDCNRVNNWNHGPIGTREQLKSYDPEGYELVKTTFRLSGDQDWRYTWLRRLPNVTTPPVRFHIDPFYTKFTWAREFTVIGRSAKDQSLLKANDTIRKMFAYRHDLLKALINDGLKLVVLGTNEQLTDLPELRNSPKTSAQTYEYDPTRKLLVVSEDDMSRIVPIFAKAFNEVAGKRAVDPNWDKRGREVQQYELRVKRLDIDFDHKLEKLFDSAKDLWPGVNDRADYWAAGVSAYFDCGKNPASIREQLERHDPGLFGLVNETMAYEGHQDWRYRP